MKVPTVKVMRGGVEVVINESDFDPASDKLAGQEPMAKKAPAKKKAAKKKGS